MGSNKNEYVNYGEQAAQSWKPSKIGDSIEGIFRGIRRVTGVGFEPFELGEIQTENGLFSLGGYVLIEQVCKTLPIGVRIRVEFSSTVDVGQPAPMKNYILYIHKEDENTVKTYRENLKAKTSLQEQEII